MSWSLDSTELLMLIIIVAVLGITLAFMAANFGTQTKEKEIVTFKNDTCSFQPISAPIAMTTSNGLVVSEATINGCDVVRIL